MAKWTTDPDAELAQAHSDMMVETWASNDPRLAERFSGAMKKACAEYPADLSAALRSAWESDPELRAKFGEAMSEGLRKMWADPARRAQMGRAVSERSRKMWADPATYVRLSEAIKQGRKQAFEQGDLRERMSMAAKKAWAEGTGEKVRAALARKIANGEFGAGVSARLKRDWSDPEKRRRMVAALSAAAKESWSDPEKRAQRIAKVKAARARPRQSCLSCGEMFTPDRANAKFCCRSCRQRANYERAKPQEPRTCLSCGKIFVPKLFSKLTTVFCSKSCKNRGYRAANRERLLEYNRMRYRSQRATS
jgi:hypothetical protein